MPTLGAGGGNYSHFQNGVILGNDSVAGVSGSRAVEQLNAKTYANAGNNTYTVADILGGIILRDTNGGARSDTTPTATALRDALVNNGKGPALRVGSAIRLHIRNTAAAANTLTILAGSGITISGTATVAQNNAKDFLLVFTNVTNSPAATLYSLGTFVF